MSFLSGLAATIIEWLLSKGFVAAEGAIASWLAKRKSDQALQANQANLNQAIKNGDDHAIENAGENSLNNSGGN